MCEKFRVLIFDFGTGIIHFFQPHKIIFIPDKDILMMCPFSVAAL